MWTCKHCNNDFSFERTTEKANHSRWCESNPKAQQFKEDNSKRRTQAVNDKFGVIKPFPVSCAHCDETFLVEERENLFPQQEQYFCSRSCANHRGSGHEWAEKRNVEITNYTTLCWIHHDKKCVVCGEENIVAVHHFDGDHSNNEPENLIPLCPTHHSYWHSRFRHLIEEKVVKYRNKFIKILGR